MTSTPSRPASSAGSETLPVLPLRDIVVFPHMIVPLFVGREKSIRALEDVMREEKRILLVAQKNPADDDPQASAIYEVGTLAQVLQLLKLPDGTVKVLVEGLERAKIETFTERTEFFEAKVKVLPNDSDDAAETEALSRTAQRHKIASLSHCWTQAAQRSAARSSEPSSRNNSHNSAKFAPFWSARRARASAP